jgi:hypothetical protein
MNALKHSIWLAAWLAGGAGVALAAGGADERADNKTLAVPRVRTPPVVDGVINAAEWKDASAVTGLSNFKNNSLAPEIQQSVWWFGFDDDHLYVAVRSPVPPGGGLVAIAKKSYVASGRDILFDDHIELQFIPSSNPITGTTRGFYKWAINPRDTVAECHMVPREGLVKDDWRSGFTYKSRLTDQAWDIEMAIPVKGMGVDKLESGMEWLTWFARCSDPGGAFFFAWEPVAYKTFARFPLLRFDETAPAVQFLQLGGIMRGDLDMRLRMAGPPAGEVNVTVNVAVQDGAGRTILDEKQDVVLKKDESRDVAIVKKTLAISQAKVEANTSPDHYNRIDIRVAAQGKPARDLLRYTARFAYEGADFQEFWVNRWVKGRTVVSDYQFDARYFPYADTLEAWVDTEIQGIAREIREARTLQAAVLREGDKDAQARGTAAIAPEGYGRLVMDVPKLAASTRSSRTCSTRRGRSWASPGRSRSIARHSLGSTTPSASKTPCSRRSRP